MIALSYFDCCGGSWSVLDLSSCLDLCLCLFRYLMLVRKKEPMPLGFELARFKCKGQVMKLVRCQQRSVEEGKGLPWC